MHPRTRVTSTTHACARSGFILFSFFRFLILSLVLVPVVFACVSALSCVVSRCLFNVNYWLFGRIFSILLWLSSIRYSQIKRPNELINQSINRPHHLWFPLADCGPERLLPDDRYGAHFRSRRRRGTRFFLFLRKNFDVSWTIGCGWGMLLLMDFLALFLEARLEGHAQVFLLPVVLCVFHFPLAK